VCGFAVAAAVNRYAAVVPRKVGKLLIKAAVILAVSVEQDKRLALSCLKKADKGTARLNGLLSVGARHIASLSCCGASDMKRWRHGFHR
jgi:hypothetical protein